LAETDEYYPPDGNTTKWWVYVLKGSKSSGSGKKEAYYVGCTTDYHRRLRQHNGEIAGGAKSTRSGRPWSLRAVFGPYDSRSAAMSAEHELKHSRRGKRREMWTPQDSDKCIMNTC
jgi:predicted GIY-YIG superfamily endonuclease